MFGDARRVRGGLQMRKIPALLLLVAVASCTSTPQTPKPAPSTAAGAATVALTDAERAAVESAVRARLTATATIRTMIAQRDAGGAVTVCGYVNPGAGDTPFIGMLVEGGFIVTDLGGPTERTIAVQKACHGRGIYI
jgi:hypothetical protein